MDAREPCVVVAEFDGGDTRLRTFDYACHEGREEQLQATDSVLNMVYPTLELTYIGYPPVEDGQ